MSSKIVFSSQEMEYIQLLHSLVDVNVIDCIHDEYRVVYVVEEGQAGRTIGKNGENVKKLNQIIKKEIEIIEYSNDPEKFMRNLLHAIEVENLTITKGKEGLVAIIRVKDSSRGRLIGKNGRNIHKIRKLAKRHHNFETIKIE